MKLNVTGLFGVVAIGVASCGAVLSMASGAAVSRAASPATPAVKPSHIAGVVTSAQAGANLKGVVVTLVRDGKPTQRTLTNKDGKFVFAEIRPGTFHIVAEKPGLGAGHVGGFAKPDEIVKVAIALKKPA